MTVRTLSRRIREQEIQRQIRYNRVRKAVYGRTPELLPDYCRMLFGSTIGLAIGAWLLQRFAHLDPRYVLPSIGFVYSAQAASYKLKLARGPDFKVPNCGCAGGANDRTEAVLLGSAYPGYVMIVKIGGLCSTCVNIAAVNVLLVVHLVR